MLLQIEPLVFFGLAATIRCLPAQGPEGQGVETADRLIRLFGEGPRCILGTAACILFSHSKPVMKRTRGHICALDAETRHRTRNVLLWRQLEATVRSFRRCTARLVFKGALEENNVKYSAFRTGWRSEMMY